MLNNFNHHIFGWIILFYNSLTPQLQITGEIISVYYGKGNKQRVVPIRPELHQVLEKRLKEIPNGLLWPNPFTGKMRPDIRLGTECKKLGLTRIRPHDLRHAFGASSTRSGVGLRALQEIMGHSTPVITELYSQLNADDLLNEIKKMD